MRYQLLLAFDYLIKPFKHFANVIRVVEKAIKSKRLKAENERLISELSIANDKLLKQQNQLVKKITVKDQLLKTRDSEIFLLQAHISHLETTNSAFRYDEIRKRKLLMHRKEINKLFVKVSKTALTIVPTKLYINNKNMVKVEIALAQGKDLHDKREALKEKSMKREMSRVLKEYR